MKKSWFLTVLKWCATAALFCLPALMGCGCGKPRAMPPLNIPPRPVQTAKAFTRDVPHYIGTFGYLTPLEDVDIIPQVSGELLRIHFAEGAEIKTNQTLFTIDDRQYVVELRKAEAGLSQDQADLNMKQNTLERNRKLFKNKVISQQDFDQFQTDVAAYEARIMLDQASTNAAQLNVDNCKVKSPIKGVAGRIQVDAGNLVSAGSTKLVNIKNIDKLLVDFSVPEFYLDKIRKARESATLRVLFAPERVIDQAIERASADGKFEEHIMAVAYAGVVSFMDNTVDPETGTISMRAELDNSARKLWPGQFVHVGLILGSFKNAVLVPYNAVQMSPEGHYVYIVKNGKAVFKKVKVGEPFMNFLIIEDGVEAGETVVTVGQLSLSDGCQVNDVTVKVASLAQDQPDGSLKMRETGAKDAAPAADSRTNETNTPEQATAADEPS